VNGILDKFIPSNPSLEESKKPIMSVFDYDLVMKEPKIIHIRRKRIRTPTERRERKMAFRARQMKELQLDEEKQMNHVMDPPAKWNDIWTLVRELRQDWSSTIDRLGPHRLPDPNAPPHQYRFQVLVSFIVMSESSKELVVKSIIQNMIDDKILDVHTIADMDPEHLYVFLRNKVSYWKTRAQSIHSAAVILRDQYQCDLPRTAAEMTANLPGIGRRDGFWLENICWNTQSGIPVDRRYMFRILNLLQWTFRAQHPEMARWQLESWLPHSHWGDVYQLFVGLGQDIEQRPHTILRKALSCSRPEEALQLLHKLGLDYRSVATEKEDLEERVNEVFRIQW
jgi:endonuclease-3